MIQNFRVYSLFLHVLKAFEGLLAFCWEEVKVLPNPGLSDTSCLHLQPNRIKVLYLRSSSGEVGALSALTPKIGPLGLSPKKVGDDIAEATRDWRDLRVTVTPTTQNRQAQTEVVPSASALSIKALKEPPRDRKKQKNIKHRGSRTYQ
ncbi:hypothetical protein GH733_004711, partial [Mirounga leonina]